MNSEMIFLESALDNIRNTVGSQRAESGGILLGSRDDWIVQKFVFDPYGSCSGAAYDPDVKYLNKIVKEEWENNRLAFLGFVHSHPPGVRRLSGDYGNGTGDLGYLRKIFAAMPSLQYFLVPIVFSKGDVGHFEILPFIAERNAPERYRQVEVVSMPTYQSTSAQTVPETGKELQHGSCRANNDNTKDATNIGYPSQQTNLAPEAAEREEVVESVLKPSPRQALASECREKAMYTRKGAYATTIPSNHEIGIEENKNYDPKGQNGTHDHEDTTGVGPTSSAKHVAKDKHRNHFPPSEACNASANLRASPDQSDCQQSPNNTDL